MVRNQRDYAHPDQLGLEKDFREYVEKLVMLFEKTKRVLKPTATVWINLDDTYGGSGNRSGHTPETSNLNRLTIGYGAAGSNAAYTKGYSKSLLCIPDRFKIAMVDNGWKCRNEIAWIKNSIMPESVQDRLTNSWEKVFFFSLNNKYYFEQQFETANYDGRKDTMFKGSEKYRDGFYPNDVIGDTMHRKGLERWRKDPKYNGETNYAGDSKNNQGHSGYNKIKHPYIRNARNIIYANSEPTTEKHYATYPTKLIQSFIIAGCPEFICKKCGKIREQLIKKTKREKCKDYKIQRIEEVEYGGCNCNEGFESGIILDFFMGSGTTAEMCLRLNRRFIGIELNPEYITIANKRIDYLRNQLNLNF